MVRYVPRGRENLLQLIDILRQQNLDLLHSRGQQAKLAKSHRTVSSRSQPPKQSLSMASLSETYRGVPKSYICEGLSATDMCTCHVWNLQLDGNLS
jgi:hypothetical protein